MDENKKNLKQQGAITHNSQEQIGQDPWGMHLDILQSIKDWDWKKAYREPAGKAFVAVMSVGATTGLYTLYEKFQSVPHPIHPVAKLGGLAVAVAGSIGLCEVLAGKEPNKLEQEPRETLDSWKDKISARRVKEKEAAHSVI